MNFVYTINCISFSYGGEKYGTVLITFGTEML